MFPEKGTHQASPDILEAYLRPVVTSSGGMWYGDAAIFGAEGGRDLQMLRLEETLWANRRPRSSMVVSVPGLKFSSAVRRNRLP